MEMLRPRPDRIDQVFRLGRGHHKNHAVRGFLPGLYQPIGSFAGQHVGSVEDNYLAARRCGGIAHHFPQLANLVDAAIGGRVNFDYVERSPRRDFFARITFTARVRSRSLDAIQRFCKNSCRRSLPHAACSGKNVSMRYAVVANSVGERLRDMALSDKVPECLGPPLACDDLIAHGLRRIMDDLRRSPGRSGLTTARADGMRREELRVVCGTQDVPDTVAPFRAWRGSRDLVAQSPKFHAPAVA